MNLTVPFPVGGWDSWVFGGEVDIKLVHTPSSYTPPVLKVGLLEKVEEEKYRTTLQSSSLAAAQFCRSLNHESVVLYSIVNI